MCVPFVGSLPSTERFILLLLCTKQQILAQTQTRSNNRKNKNAKLSLKLILMRIKSILTGEMDYEKFV